jgi:hypothetical protein
MKYGDGNTAKAPLKRDMKDSRTSAYRPFASTDSLWGRAITSIGSAAMRLHEYRNLHSAMVYDVLRDVDCTDHS